MTDQAGSYLLCLLKAQARDPAPRIHPLKQNRRADSLPPEIRLNLTGSMRFFP